MRIARLLTLCLSMLAACGGTQRSAAREDSASSEPATRPVRLAPHTDSEGELHTLSATDDADAVAPPPVEPP